MGWWSELTELVYPSSCASCGKSGSGILCGDCRRSIAALKRGYCIKCGYPHDRVLQGCAYCRARPYSFSRVISASQYTGGARKAVLQLKKSGNKRLAAELAGIMVEAAGNDPDIICPDAVSFVPCTRRKTRERGFNPAELLALEVSRILGTRLFAGLAKRRETNDQSGLPLVSRMTNPAGAFEVAGGCRSPSRVLLVDDVLTTGSTASECADVLMRAGAGRVSVLVASRAVLPTFMDAHII